MMTSGSWPQYRLNIILHLNCVFLIYVMILLLDWPHFMQKIQLFLIFNGYRALAHVILASLCRGTKCGLVLELIPFSLA